MPKRRASAPPIPEQALTAFLSGGLTAAAFVEQIQDLDPRQVIPALVTCLGRQAEYVRDMAILTERVNAGQTLEEVLGYIFTEFRGFIPCDRLGVSLLEPDGETVKAIWARTDLPQQLLGHGYTGVLTGSSLGQILRSGEPRIINDLEEYLRLKPSSQSTALIVREGLRSSLTCPLIAQGKPIGFLFFSSRRAGAFRKDHCQTFQRLAGNLAVIIDKARAYERLVELNLWKDRFLGMAAHDLRSPIALIVSYLEMIQTGVISREEKECDDVLAKVQRICDRMLLLISDLLDVTAIESGALELKKSRVAPATFFAEVATGARLLAKAKDIALTTTFAPALPEILLDEQRIRQVVDNLITNAIKFSPPKTRIHLDVQVKNGKLCVEIQDQGPGIPEADRKKLFQFFGKTSVRPTGGEKSTGLGLAIVRKIVELHGGTVDVRSEVGKGSTFFFLLPF